MCSPQLGEAERLASRSTTAFDALQIPPSGLPGGGDTHRQHRVQAILSRHRTRSGKPLTEQADQALYHAKSQGAACTLAYR